MPPFKSTKRLRYEWLVDQLSKPLTDQCILWPFETQRGYGTLHLLSSGRPKVFAHRLAYKLHYGVWPNPCGRHTCDVSLCFNPLHIVAGTVAENNRDMLDRGHHRNQYTGPLPKRLRYAVKHGRELDITLYAWLVEAIRKHGDSDGCLLWPWPVNASGFPRLRDLAHRNILAHRLVFRLIHGREAVPFATQTCQDHTCISPRHIAESSKIEAWRKAGHNGANNRRGERNGSAKLDAEKVREIRRMYASGHYSQQRIADQFSVGQNTVSCILLNKTWGHVSVP